MEYLVKLTACAVLESQVYVHAGTPEQAETQAIEMAMAGAVDWPRTSLEVDSAKAE